VPQRLSASRPASVIWSRKISISRPPVRTFLVTCRDKAFFDKQHGHRLVDAVLYSQHRLRTSSWLGREQRERASFGRRQVDREEGHGQRIPLAG